MRAYFFGTGPGTVVPGGLHAFVKTRPELAVPDIEFMFRGAPAQPHLWFPLIRPAYADGYGIRPTLLHPDSRGEIRLRSTDPRDPPRIIYNFFSALERSPAPARRLQARARRRLSEADGSLSRRRDLAGREREDRCRDRCLDPEDRDHRASSLRHLRDGHRSRRGARSGAARARQWSACAWSTPRSCPIWSRRISMPAC